MECGHRFGKWRHPTAYQSHHARIRVARSGAGESAGDYHWFEELSHFHLGIPGTNIDMGLGHWAQDGLLTIFFLVVGLELRQELTTGSLSNVRAAAVPMLCAVGGMLVPPVLFVAVISLFSNFGAGDPGSLIIANGSMFSFARRHTDGRFPRPRTSHSRWRCSRCSPRRCLARSVPS